MKLKILCMFGVSFGTHAKIESKEQRWKKELKKRTARWDPIPDLELNRAACSHLRHPGSRVSSSSSKLISDAKHFGWLNFTQHAGASLAPLYERVGACSCIIDCGMYSLLAFSARPATKVLCEPILYQADIIQASKDLGSDIIVMGKHRRGRLQQLILG